MTRNFMNTMLCIASLVALVSAAQAASFHTIDYTNGVADFLSEESLQDPSDDSQVSTRELLAAHVTWDADYLYVAASATGGNFMDIFIDKSSTSTLTEMNALPWSKKISFEGWNPNYALVGNTVWASYDLLRIDSNTTSTNVMASLTAAGGQVAYGTGTYLGIKLPWSFLGGVQAHQKIRVAFTISGNSWSALDAMPQQTDGPNNLADNDVLDYWFEVNVDADGDAVPDQGYAFETDGSSVPVELSGILLE